MSLGMATSRFLYRVSFFPEGSPAPQAVPSEAPCTLGALDAGLSGSVALATTSVCWEFSLVLGGRFSPVPHLQDMQISSVD